MPLVCALASGLLARYDGEYVARLQHVVILGYFAGDKELSRAARDTSGPESIRDSRADGNSDGYRVVPERDDGNGHDVINRGTRTSLLTHCMFAYSWSGNTTIAGDLPPVSGGRGTNRWHSCAAHSRLSALPL